MPVWWQGLGALPRQCHLSPSSPGAQNIFTTDSCGGRSPKSIWSCISLSVRRQNSWKSPSGGAPLVQLSRIRFSVQRIRSTLGSPCALRSAAHARAAVLVRRFRVHLVYQKVTFRGTCVVRICIDVRLVCKICGLWFQSSSLAVVASEMRCRLALSWSCKTFVTSCCRLSSCRWHHHREPCPEAFQGGLRAGSIHRSAALWHSS